MTGKLSVTATSVRRIIISPIGITNSRGAATALSWREWPQSATGRAPQGPPTLRAKAWRPPNPARGEQTPRLFWILY